MSNTATILGESCEIAGWTKEGNLLLADKREFTFEPWRERSFDFRDTPLVEVARLRELDAGWMLDEKPYDNWRSALVWRAPDSGNAWCRFLLNDNLPHGENVRDIRAVAWFEGHDEKPVFLRSFRQVVTSSESTTANEATETLRKRVRVAEELANLTLEESLQKWFRFDPPGMSADTKARIEKAVKIYMIDPEKRSLAKVAAEFGVARKTVSTWFVQFTQHTGFKVVTHRRHEKVSAHLRGDHAATHLAPSEDEPDEEQATQDVVLR